MKKLIERIAALLRRPAPEPDYEADVPPRHITYVWGSEKEPPVKIGDW